MALIPKMPANIPMYLPRSDGGKRSPLIAIVLAIKTPAPKPCKPRKSTNCVMSCEKPDKADPDKNTTSPIKSRGFRP